MDTGLTNALQKAKLLAYFNSLPPSHRKEYLTWINGAQKAETRLRRTNQMIEMLRTKQ
jgi:uncharacterized protein YdeI (YjbR/CyaY-like superfamily)